ncbi:YbhB/YbcL family Raf kinase inhibitor-like protein [Jatrophihabitans telluris]|uniref:YbhB/YbcL family Raf kinase inhibitor-like protein n=1 Tax=Jatrophihabitans telluris TaxID=2038343 RepID=A0ABY4QUP9_9ACTN|nr:YbhB/YbcL family Raf kinase inhibitor-like protein [Jatrophihabitans telluris]UQX87014.1 YbhB/YbcL family Raf kinase inhibitor-like protein [Jatrophihabitans telluris]
MAGDGSLRRAGKHGLLAAVAPLLLVLGAGTGCTTHHATGVAEHGPLTLSSPAFAAESMIPLTYGCTGAGNAPPLVWHGAAPAGTAGWAIVLQDLDVTPAPWLQWVVSDLPTSTRTLGTAPLPSGAVVSAASNGTVGYVGACPRSGTVNRYRFTVYALRTRLALSAHLPAAKAMSAISASALASSSVTGSFAR